MISFPSRFTSLKLPGAASRPAIAKEHHLEIGCLGPTGGLTWAIGCLIVLFAFISPRLAILGLWLFTNLLSRAFDSWFVPFLGFFLLPWTTLAYAVMWDSGHRVSGFEWFIVILAFLIDLASYAQEGRRRQAVA